MARFFLLNNILTRLLSMPIRAQILLLAFIVAIPAAGIIMYSGIQMREGAIRDARMETQRLAENIAAEQQNLIAAAQQLITALAQLPDVKRQNANRVDPVLRDILKLNTQYSNIFITDRSGLVWATAVPHLLHQSVSDRRYFQNALASEQLSSGEYAISRATARPVFNIAAPLRNERGVIIGVICVGFVLDADKQVLRAKLPTGTSFILLDHKGIVIYRAISPEGYIGTQYDSVLFKQMQDGPDVYTYSNITTISGDDRILTYRKLRLPGEQSPYMYIRAGIPITAVLADANKMLIRNLALFTSFLALAVFFAWFVGKRSIADRVTLLENASRKLAGGDLHVRVSDVVAGGELGRLGQTFDSMARQLLLREQALVESERNYRDIFNTTTDAIFVHDADSGNIIKINKTAEELYGYSRDEILHRTIQDFSSGESPYSLREAVALIRKTFKEGPQHFEWLARKKNRELFWTEVVLSATRIGGSGRVLAVIRDITERKKMDEEKQKLQTQLLQVQKMESIGQLAGGIAHDFNNILAAIVGYGNIIQMKMQTDDPLKVYMGQILAAAERAASLTQSLLAFSRKQTISPRNIDLNESIHNIEKFLSRIIGEDIVLSTSLSSETLTIFVDPTQIEQVMMNLASNARDAMPKGGRLMIETGLVMVDDEYVKTHGFASSGHYAVLTVSDTGEGMDEQTQKKIFDPFFTTKELGRGTGLGLAIVYGIVKQNNGYIDLYSEIGKGTTFKIYLPLASVRTVEDRTPEVQQPLLGGAETILLAEDNEIVRRLNRDMLREFRYTVIEAGDGEEALQKFRENQDRIRLLILDVIMPKKNGREVFEEVRRSNPNAKVIFTSGYPADLIQKEGVLEQGLHFLSKPSSPQALLLMIRKVLNQ
jgi:PAS domain S-box-containing protein